MCETVMGMIAAR